MISGICLGLLIKKWLCLITGRSLCVVHVETRVLIIARGMVDMENQAHTSGSSSFRAEMALAMLPLWMACWMSWRLWMDGSGC